MCIKKAAVDRRFVENATREVLYASGERQRKIRYRRDRPRNGVK